MIKDDELWLKKMKERLDNYSEPLPDTGWERLEKSLPTSPPMSVGTRKNVLFRRWAMAAAAVVLVAVSSIGLWLMQSPVVDDMRRSVDPALADMPDALQAGRAVYARGFVLFGVYTGDGRKIYNAVVPDGLP